MLERILNDQDWLQVWQDAEIARSNRARLETAWCIVCGHAAAEDHPHRFHAAGGCLAGPFCSRWCAFAFLQDGRNSDRAEMRTERRARA